MRKEIYTWATNGVSYPVRRVFIIGGYCGLFTTIEKLVAIAIADFPFVKKEEVAVGRISNSQVVDRCWCISFLIEMPNIHADYYEGGPNMNFDW